MNLLIIDDEYFIVQGLVEMIDKEALGIDRIFTAYGAEQGWTLEKSIDLGIASAAASLSDSSATGGMCAQAQAMELFDKFPRR